MLKLYKKELKKNKIIFFKSIFFNINIFYIDTFLKIPNNIKIFIKKNNIIFISILGNLNLEFKEEIYFFKKKNKLILIINLKKKKKF